LLAERAMKPAEAQHVHEFERRFEKAFDKIANRFNHS
jgi:hypothetical protein